LVGQLIGFGEAKSRRDVAELRNTGLVNKLGNKEASELAVINKLAVVGAVLAPVKPWYFGLDGF